MSTDREITSMHGCLARVIWIVLGPVLLLLCAVIIALTEQIILPGVMDIIYGGLLVVIIIARMIDRPPKPKKISENQVVNKQITEEYRIELKSASRYIIIVSLISIMLWLVAHFVVKGII